MISGQIKVNLLRRTVCDYIKSLIPVSGSNSTSKCSWHLMSLHVKIRMVITFPLRINKYDHHMTDGMKENNKD